MIIAMQALFILYIASKDFLKYYNPGRKFLFIKLIVIIAAVQKFIIDLAVPHSFRLQKYDSQSLKWMWNCFFLSLESVIFSLLMLYAFPLNELLKHQQFANLGDDPSHEIEVSIELEEGKTKLISDHQNSSSTMELKSPTSMSSENGLLHRQDQITGKKSMTTETNGS